MLLVFSFSPPVLISLWMWQNHGEYNLVQILMCTGQRGPSVLLILAARTTHLSGVNGRRASLKDNLNCMKLVGFNF
jgi:hypothetical protein